MTKTNTTKTVTKINYANLPKALRMAACNDAVDRITNGENPNAVAKAFGTSLALVLSWVKRFNEGTLGSHMTNDANAEPIDYRNLTPELRTAGRKSAIAKVKAGETPRKVARKFGTTELSVRRWVENDNNGIESEQKRGRKTGSHVIKADAPTDVQIPTVGKKRGRKPKTHVADVKKPYTGKKRGRKPKVLVTTEVTPIQQDTHEGQGI